MRAADLDPEREVYVTGAPSPVHVRTSCPAVGLAKNVMRKRADVLAGDRAVCGKCTGGHGAWSAQMSEVGDWRSDAHRLLERATPEELGL